MALRAGPDLEVDIRAGNVQFIEEQGRHLLIVMLAGMDQAMSNGRQTAFGLFPVKGLQGMNERGDLHEIGPRPDHRHDSKRFQA